MRLFGTNNLYYLIQRKKIVSFSKHCLARVIYYWIKKKLYGLKKNVVSLYFLFLLKIVDNLFG